MQSSHIGVIDEDDRKTICEFVTKSFNSNQRKLFGAEFVDSMNIGNANLPGIPVTDEEAASIKASMQVGSGDKHEDFFRRSLNKLCLRGEKTFWHENADRFQDVL